MQFSLKTPFVLERKENGAAGESNAERSLQRIGVAHPQLGVRGHGPGGVAPMALPYQVLGVTMGFLWDLPPPRLPAALPSLKRQAGV